MGRLSFIVILTLVFTLCISCTNQSTSNLTANPTPEAEATATSAIDTTRKTIVTPTPAATIPPPIAKITIRTASQWNDFARKYNSGHSYTDDMTVTIAGSLDFLDIDFVPLCKPFSGTIQGQSEVAGYAKDNVRHLLCVPPYLASDGGYGFFNISSLDKSNTEMVYPHLGEDKLTFLQYDLDTTMDDYLANGRNEISEPNALFGIRCGKLTLENLVFSGISGVSYICATAADELTMRNIEITDCTIEDTWGLIADNAGRLTMENVLVTHCSVILHTIGGGLVNWVYGDANLTQISIALTDIVLHPDSGGSGYGIGYSAMLVSDIGGDAAFDNISIHNSTLFTLSSVALSYNVGGTVSVRDIAVLGSTFTGFPRSDHNSMYGKPANGLLFGSGVQLAPEAIQNVRLYASVFNAAESFDYYRKLGYTIKDCAFADGAVWDEWME